MGECLRGMNAGHIIMLSVFEDVVFGNTSSNLHKIEIIKNLMNDLLDIDNGSRRELLFGG